MSILKVISTHDLTVYALKFIKLVFCNSKKRNNMCLIHKMIVRILHSKSPDQIVSFELTDLSQPFYLVP